MRINQFVARSSGLSRRAADKAIADERVTVNGLPATLGQNVTNDDQVKLDRQLLKAPTENQTVILNKPTGYVVSRDGQGSPSIYDLLPNDLNRLKAVGRLDKYSSGILLLTSDGQLANELLHPRYVKEKVYELTINKPLLGEHRQKIESGVQLDDGISSLKLNGNGDTWTVTMHEGRNRQIRRTFEALGYRVMKLHRVSFGDYRLGKIAPGNWQFIKKSDII